LDKINFLKKITKTNMSNPKNIKEQSISFITTIAFICFICVSIQAFFAPPIKPDFEPKISSISENLSVETEAKTEQIVDIEESSSTKKEDTKPQILETKKVKNDCAVANFELQEAINQVAQEEDIDCRLLMTIAKVESNLNPNAKLTGCNFIRIYNRRICENSYGAFMINLDAHSKNVTREQALDPLFSTKWTARRIKNQYGGKPDSTGLIKDWIVVLSCHQGQWKTTNGWQCGSNNYRQKIEKAGLKLGLQY
jgi:Transglycosylase SLT domain